jgi:hypothetical protein
MGEGGTMGVFKGVVVQNGGEFTVREAGTYELRLVEVHAGLRDTKFQEEPKPALRFIWEDEEGRLSDIVNIPAMVRLPDGSYGLRWNEKSRFWEVLGALWGRLITEADAPLLEMLIPGVNSPEDLAQLPHFFVPDQEPVQGVIIRMGEEVISEAGRPVLATVVKKPGQNREVNVITGYAPVPRKKAQAQAAKVAGSLW